MTGSWRWGLLAVALSSGCLPVAVPPMRVRAAAGPSIAATPSGPDAHPSQPSYRLGAAVHPLQAVRGAEQRPFDVGIGYGFEAGAENTRDTYLHMAELSGGYYPLSWKAGTARGRLGAFTTAEILAGRDSGWGATAGTALELTGFSDSSSSDESFAGMAWGQWAIALELSAGYRSLGPASYYTTMVGVAARIPFVAGVACCADAGDVVDAAVDSALESDDDDDWGEDSGDDGGSPSRTPASPKPARTKPARTPASPRAVPQRTPAKPTVQ